LSSLEVLIQIHKRGLAPFFFTSAVVWCKNAGHSELCYYSLILC